MIFKVHHVVFRYDICPKEYTYLLLRLVRGTISKDLEPMKRIEKRRVEKKTQIQNLLQPCSFKEFKYLLFERYNIFSHCRHYRA